MDLIIQSVSPNLFTKTQGWTTNYSNENHIEPKNHPIEIRKIIWTKPQVLGSMLIVQAVTKPITIPAPTWPITLTHELTWLAPSLIEDGKVSEGLTASFCQKKSSDVSNENPRSLPLEIKAHTWRITPHSWFENRPKFDGIHQYSRWRFSIAMLVYWRILGGSPHLVSS